MSQATVFSGAQFGLADDVTATGLYVASITWSGTSETAELPDHIGCAVGLSVYNPKKDVSCDGVIAAKATGLGDNIGSIITLANTSTNTRTRNSEGLGVTPNGGAAIIITGNTISPTQNGFEGGGISGVYLPFVSTSSPVTLT
jgi:hypothetical protein